MNIFFDIIIKRIAPRKLYKKVMSETW